MDRDQQLASATLKFLERAQISCAEAPTFMQVVQWLNEKVQPIPVENKNESKNEAA
jgi:hypothetical protein